MFAVIKYNNTSQRSFSFEILNITNTIEVADKYALKYAEELYGYDIDNSVESLYNMSNIISEYSLGDGINKFVISVMRIPNITNS